MSNFKIKFDKHNLSRSYIREYKKEKNSLGGYYRGRNYTLDLSSWNDNDIYGYGKE